MTISELSREHEKDEEQGRDLFFLKIYACTVVIWIFFIERKFFAGVSFSLV